ncbi:MAG: hypothetical protein ACAI44_18115 [Candidatus Sericytochromatia bacterium]
MRLRSCTQSELSPVALTITPSILENPFYTSVYQTHYATLDQHHPAIVSSELFYEINGHLFTDGTL